MNANELHQRVAGAMSELLNELADYPTLYEQLTSLLAQPGRFFAAQDMNKWTLFLVETCASLGGDLTITPYAAASVEFMLAAGDVIDDIADGDWNLDSSSIGSGVNSGFALSLLAQRALDRLGSLCSPQQLARIRSVVNTSVLTSCAGEDVDLHLEHVAKVEVEQAHTMTLWKSGSLVSMACVVGAALATDDETTLELISQFGTHTGVIAQLLNDCAALVPQDAHRHTDLQRRKKTLPICFALHYANEEHHAELCQWTESSHQLTPAQCERLATHIHVLGGVHYAWIVADTHWREAIATLRALQMHTGRDVVWVLRRLIPQLQARRV
jgi:geranylgeranyl pyrophosphate synthase